jgi:predicted nucleotidyltransferase
MSDDNRHWSGAKVNRDDIIAELRAHEQELRAAGVRGLSLVGSAARGEQRADSDIDVLVRLAPEVMDAGFAYFGRIDAIVHRLEALLKRPVEVIVEPVQKERLRYALDRDRAVAF